MLSTLRQSFRNSDRIFLLMALLLPFLVHWRLWTTNPYDRLYFSGDVTHCHYPFFVYMVEAIRNLGLPLWNWHVYSGMFFGGTFINTVTYPLNLPFYLGLFDLSRPAVFNLYLILHLSIGSVSFYLLARSLKFLPPLCLLGATSYAFSIRSIYGLTSFPGNLYVFSWGPFVLWAFYMFFEKKNYRFALLGGIGWFFCMLSLNPMELVPCSLLLGGWFLFLFYTAMKNGDSIKYFTFWISFSLILSLGLIASAAIPFAESTSLAPHNLLSNYDYAKQGWNFEKNLYWLVKELLLPGGDAWLFFGIITLQLYFYGVVKASSPRDRAIRNISVALGLILYGTSVVPLYDLAYHFIPLVSRMQMDRGAVGFLIPAILVALIGASKLVRQYKREASNKILVISAMILIFWVILYLFYLPVPKGQSEKAVSMFNNLALHNIIFSIIGVWIFLRIISEKKKAKLLNLIILLLIVNFLDVTALTRFLYPEISFPETKLSKSLLAKQESPYLPSYRRFEMGKATISNHRIYNTLNSQVMLQSLDNVGGYYPFHPYRVVQAYISSGFSDFYIVRGPTLINKTLKLPGKIVNALYDLSSEGKGRAFGVPLSEKEQSKEQALKFIADKNFDPHRTILLKDWSAALSEYPKWVQRLYTWFFLDPSSDFKELSDAKGTMINENVSLLNQGVNKVSFRVKPNDKFLFFSNSWHPGWFAFVNGQQTEVKLANYAFMGIELPDSQKDLIVEFLFFPASSYIGIIISISSLFIGIIFWYWDKLICLISSFKKKGIIC